jgi:hypothetical protein
MWLPLTAARNILASPGAHIGAPLRMFHGRFYPDYPCSAPYSPIRQYPPSSVIGINPRRCSGDSSWSIKSCMS